MAPSPSRKRLIGYARVSTEDQAHDAQLDELRAAGCAEVHQEHGSGASRARPVLARLLREIPAKFWQPIPRAETSREPSLRRCVLDGREPVPADPVGAVCARTAETGSSDAAATPRPAASNFRRSGIAGPLVSMSMCVGFFMLLELQGAEDRPFMTSSSFGNFSALFKLSPSSISKSRILVDVSLTRGS